MYLLALLVLPFDAKSSDMSPRSASGAESARSKLKEFDKLGSVLFMTFIGLLLACVNRGNELGWRSTPILGMAIGALCVLPLLICVERRATSRKCSTPVRLRPKPQRRRLLRSAAAATDVLRALEFDHPAQ